MFYHSYSETVKGKNFRCYEPMMSHDNNCAIFRNSSTINNRRYGQRHHHAITTHSQNDKKGTRSHTQENKSAR